MTGPEPLRVAFLGCGFITQVHSRALRSLRTGFTRSYASRDQARSDAFCRRFGGVRSYGDYASAIADPAVDAVVVAVPPRFHLDLTLQALAAGRHVLVEKPVFPDRADYARVIEARDRAGRTIVVGEMVFAHFTTIAHRLKSADDWRNDTAMAGGDAFFEEGIHWLHVAGSLGPTITSIHGFRPAPARDRPGHTDRRVKSMMVSFSHGNGAVGSLYYSREIPSLLRGLRLSKIFGRRGVITFESNGAFVVVRGDGWPRVLLPGVRDVRGYRAMYRDFARAIREKRQPEMSVERALDDHSLMDRVYASLESEAR